MEKIYDLLEHKTFATLTDNERQMVLAEMTEQEFDQYSQFIRQSETTLQQKQLSPKPIIHQNLKTSFRKKHSLVRDMTSLLSLKIPLWMVLIMMLSVGIAFSYFNQKKTHEPTKPAIEKEKEKIFVYQMDTIYIEKDTKKPPRDSAAVKYQKTNSVKTPSKTIIPTASKMNHVIEQPLTYYDSNAINNIMNSSVKGQQLDEDMPVIEVQVWK